MKIMLKRLRFGSQPFQRTEPRPVPHDFRQFRTVDFPRFPETERFFSNQRVKRFVFQQRLVDFRIVPSYTLQQFVSVFHIQFCIPLQ